uniref:Uncharacterized protein n=1 Tax=Picea glauca TaxID=3330 RepID=A0A101M409_PICGL|nr:hypothetical protein ABT39_MTgene434 [Picea glauca]QHR86672.1 hypothetical protein Q903MT_gene675 [Picea sitchensis]
MRKRARPYSVRWFRAKPLLRICLREIVIIEHPSVTQRLKASPLVSLLHQFFRQLSIQSIVHVFKGLVFQGGIFSSFLGMFLSFLVFSSNVWLVTSVCSCCCSSLSNSVLSSVRLFCLSYDRL